MCGLGDTLARAPERRETQIRAGEGISGSLSVTSSLNLGAYAGILDNLNLAGIKNPSPNLTNVYLYTPLVGPTPDPLLYVPSPGRLRQTSGYPPRITGPQSGSARRRPLPHLPCTTRTLVCVPPLVGRNCAGWFMQRI